MSFESLKAKDLVILIDEARSGEDEFIRLIEPKIFPLLNQIRKHFSDNPVPSPFFGYKDNELFMNLSALMELTRGVGESLQLRRLLLEIFSKVSVSFDPTIPVVFHITLCDVLWEAIESVHSIEEEETALIAIRIFVELYKESGSVLMDAELSTRLHRFIVWLRQMYTSSESVFDLANHTSVGVRILRECANITQSLVHAFPGAAESFLPNLVGDMIGLLNLGDTSKVSPDVAPDLFDVQVKTLGLIGTFLARLRGGEILKPFDQAISKACVRLLKSIPVDNIYVRRDLILGIRAYIQHSPEAAGWFVPFVDDLFDDAIVVGIGKSAYEILRPVVVSTLADFANLIVRSPNHVPAGDKLKKIFAYFCACMSDSELPISSQFTSARIILNIIDQLYNRAGGRGSSVKQKTPGVVSPAAPPEASAEILRDVLRAMVEKFSSLILFMPRVIALIAKKLDLEADYPVVSTLSVGDLDEPTLLLRLIGKPNVPVGIPLTDVLIEGVREVRSLIRTLLLSVKMILHCLTHRSASAPHRTLTKSDMSLVESMFEDSLKVSHLFSIAAGLVQSTGFDPVNINASSNGNGRFSSPRELAVACSVQEERDLLEQIGSVLQILPSVSLVDLLAKRIGWLIENIQVNNQLMSLANVLIQHPQSIQSVCEVVFGYIVLKGESLILTEKNQLLRQRQLILDGGDIDPAFPGLKLAESVEWTSGEIGPAAARILYHTFVPTSKIGENVKSLNTAYCLGYYEGEVDPSVTSALVAHVMPSLDSRLRVYGELVALFGLREPSSAARAIDKRDVVITLLKTLSRQTSTAGTPPITPTFLEPIIRPFVPEIVSTCLKIARTYPEDFAVYSSTILRYTFRLMGSGTKTSSSIRELSDSLPLFIETCVQMWRFFEGKSKFMQAVWLEIALTIPVRLKTLVPNFEQIMSVMVLALSSENSDCVAVALTVLESWVDGLTPDFLFPLIPGHGELSLSSALLGLTKPPFGHVVHTTVSGNNSVRATKILGKLGARTKFTLKSNNVVGYLVREESGAISTTFPLSLGSDNLAMDFDLSDAISVGLKILAKHAIVTESHPVSVGEAGLEESTTAPLVPEQELLDSFNIVMTAYVANRANDSGKILCVLGKGLIDACACSDSTVAERARVAVNDLIVTDVQTCFEHDKKNLTLSLPGVVVAAIKSLRGDKGSGRQLETSISLISAFLEEYVRTFGRSSFSARTVLTLVNTVSEQLVSGDWADQMGAGTALLTLLPLVPKLVLSADFVLALVKNCITGYSLAEGTSATIPSLKTQRVIADLSVAIAKTVFGSSKFSGDRDLKPQESQTQWLGTHFAHFTPLISLCISEFCVDNKSLAEFLLYVISDIVNVSVSALVCWVDEKMDTFVDGLKNTRLPGHGNHPVFKIASFILQLRPAPVLAADGGERLHLALLDSINKAIEWLEREDDLAIVYGAVAPLPGGGPPPPGVAPHQHQSYLMQRGVLRRSLMNWTDQNTKILQAVRVVKLTVLHTQLGASGQPTTVPGYLTPGAPAAPVVGGELAVNPAWRLEDRIIITLGRMLFSFDPETVAAASYSITSMLGIGTRISDLVWKQSLLVLAREIASRAPIAMNEIQGLGRLLFLLPAETDDSIRVDLTERLFERMHTYLGVLRERTFAPIQQAILQNNLPGGIPSQTSGPVISWRAGVHSDSVVVLAANTLACFSGLVSDRLPLTERLLVLATQLDSALPATHGTGQLTSPFLAPLVASLCRDPERTADQLLTKMEIHKVFGFVAELVSLKSCLGLRKALQDRCHQMSSTETTGVLMMRTPAASLISVLARHDPSFLWLQYASSAAMMKTTTAIRSVSLVESIVRNWESAVAGLTTSTTPGTPSGGMCVCPGGILGPIDMTNSVTGYEGRIIAWTIMQFIRAPVAVSPAIVEDMESHLNVRVRLLIRLATCLSLRTMIDVSPVRDWFLTEAVELTSENEKVEIVSKAIEAFQDSTISVGCKYALLKYLVVPQVSKLSSCDVLPIDKLVSVLLNVHAHTTLVEEAIRVEIVRLCGTLISGSTGASSQATQFLLSNLSIDRYLTRQWTQSLLCELIGSRNLPNNVLHMLLRSMVIEDSSRRRAVSYDLRNAHVLSTVGKQIAEVLQSDSELVAAIVSRLQGARDLSGANLGLWRWFILIARAASSSSVIPQSLLRVCLSAVGKSKLTSGSATTDMRVIGLELLSLVADWAYQLKDKGTAQLVANTVVRLVVVGPEPSVNIPVPGQQGSGSSGTTAPSSAVSPTLISEFLNKCVVTFTRCMETYSELKLDLSAVIDQASLMLPKQTPQAPSPAGGSNGNSPTVNMETIRHCRSLVCVIRVLNEYYKLSPSATSSGHLLRLIGLAMISTDKSVCQILCLLVETLIASGRFPVDSDLVQYIVSGISAGLAVASNKTSGRVRVNPLNPNSHTFSVTPYMGVALCIAVLRGMVRAGYSISDSLGWLQSSLKEALVHALTQGTRSFVFSLLPQHLHQYPLSGTKFSPPPLDPTIPAEISSSGFAYPGTLQGPDYVVPTLLHTFRLCQLILTKDDLSVFRNTVMWLIESLGPFLTFSTPNHQTFSHLLNGLNFTVPQQSQKLSGGGASPGGLASVFSIVQLTALMRFLVIDIIASWCNVRRPDDQPGMISEKMIEESTPSLILSLSTSLVGEDALRNICDLSLLQRNGPISPRNSKSTAFDAKAIDCIVHVIECMDGLSILSAQSDPSVKRLLGFVPKRAVTCFPGSVLSTAETHGWIGSNVAGLWSSRSCFGGLFGVAVDVLIDVMENAGQQDLVRMLPAVLIVAVSGEQILRNQFLPVLRSFVPSGTIDAKIDWIMNTCPWDKVAGRCTTSIVASLLLVGCDDRVWMTEEKPTTSPKKPAAPVLAIPSLDTSLSAQWEWLHSLVSLIQVDTGLAYSTAQKMFTAIFDMIGPESSQKLINSFLGKPFLSRQSLFGQSLVGAILASANCAITVPMLVHCARHHGLYFEVLDILESMAVVDTDNFEISSAIDSLYRDLNDKDGWLGALLLRGTEKETAAAISYMQQNRAKEARGILEHTMNSLAPEDQSTIAPLWTEVNKSLSQWSNLLDVVGEVKDPELKLEIFGNTNEWGQVAELMSQFDWSMKSWSKLYAAYLALSFSDSCHSGSDAPVKQKLFLADMEASLNRSYHNLVASWNLVENSEDDSLLLCQEFIEFGESANLVTEIRAAITGAKPAYPTPKQLLNTWRDRLPDKCDSIANWCEVLNLRMIIFRHIQTQCAADVVASSHIAPYLHDYPWSLVKMAHVAAKDGHSDLAQSALQRFQSSITRSTTDAFNQEFFEALREQIRIYRLSNNETDWRIGLNVLNSCVISNTNAQQASEISLMQGRLLAKLGKLEEAKNALQMSVNTYPMIASGWSNLGDVLFETTAGGNSEECLMAYMQTVSLRSSKAVRLIPRMLLMVEKFGLKSLAEKCTDSQPSSVWIFWVPVLVRALGSKSPSLATTAKALLKKLATTFPQSVFFALHDGTVSEADRQEILNQVKDGSVMESFRSQLLEAFGSFDTQELNAWIVKESLNDLRFGRANVSELKSRLAGLIKGEPSESVLVKWLEKALATPASSGDSSSVGERLDIARFVSTICGNIEILGNYTRFISVPVGSTLESMSTVQIVGLDHRFDTVRESGMNVPVISFIGSNGLKYSFAVRPSSGPDDSGLTAQLIALCNSLMSNYSQTKQRALQLMALQSIPLSTGVIMEEVVPSALNFERILDNRYKSSDIVDTMVHEFEKIESKNGSKAAMDAMINFTPDDILISHVNANTCADMYKCSRTFTRAMGGLSILDHLVGIAPTKRSLSEMCVSKESGDLFVRVTGLNARMGDSNIAFRLTRNIQSMIGDRNMVGLLPATMRAVVDCIDKKATRFMEFLDLIGLLTQHEGLSANATRRLNGITEQDSEMGESLNLLNRIVELMSESMDASNLAQVQPRQFLPWF